MNMRCSTCAFVASAVSLPSLTEAYFEHRAAVHGQPIPPPHMTVLALLACDDEDVDRERKK